MKNKTALILIIFCVLMMCSLFSCSKENGGQGMFFNSNQPLSSPSGKYEAIIEEYDDNGVKSYKLYIVDVMDDEDAKYTVDLIFRARDKNYVFWADAEDILWGYSGDVGTYFWVNEGGPWVKKTYADNQDAIVPQALKDARPNKYK